MANEHTSLVVSDCLDVKTIDELLHPLSLHINDFYNMFSIVNSSGEVIHFAESIDDYDHWPSKAYAANLKDVWRYLCLYQIIIRRIDINLSISDIIENPYYGCTCLEEAMIKKDLIT